MIREELEVNLASLKKEDLSQLNEENSTATIYSVMETWSFESAVKSGNYILLNKDLRKEISDVYVLMELANKQSDNITDLTFVIKTTQLEVENYNRIVKIQKEDFATKHRELIPKIEALIKNLG